MAIKGALEEMVGNPGDLVVPVVFEAHFCVRFGLGRVLGGDFGGFTVNIYLFFKFGKH